MDQISNHLMNAFGICVDSRETVRQVDDKVDVASGSKWLKSLHRRQYSFTDRHRLEAERNLARFDSGKL